MKGFGLHVSGEGVLYGKEDFCELFFFEPGDAKDVFVALLEILVAIDVLHAVNRSNAIYAVERKVEIQLLAVGEFLVG